jgi:hypothetical protein
MRPSGSRVRKWSSIPFDGTLDQSYQNSQSVKTKGINNLVGEEKETVYPRGSVFEYEDGKEFKLERRYIEKPSLPAAGPEVASEL